MPIVDKGNSPVEIVEGNKVLSYAKCVWEWEEGYETVTDGLRSLALKEELGGLVIVQVGLFIY